jgi:hypothetical protein
MHDLPLANTTPRTQNLPSHSCEGCTSMVGRAVVVDATVVVVVVAAVSSLASDDVAESVVAADSHSSCGMFGPPG